MACKIGLSRGLGLLGPNPVGLSRGLGLLGPNPVGLLRGLGLLGPNPRSGSCFRGLGLLGPNPVGLLGGLGLLGPEETRSGSGLDSDSVCSLGCWLCQGLHWLSSAFLKPEIGRDM
jgi:hypothetical protein